MRFLLDQDVYAVTARFLQSLGAMLSPWPRLGFHRQMMKICSTLPGNKIESL